ncbi:hypothetical protein CK203_043082 [Vitis vinifera]|uniref:Uncharacterized protein n=1 Tax=Vitis vinifera TaxID=29760 RepID=A0A438GXC0_VITVI|nr:hypothetical protein CK203_043082 [Vitis vinifera]
MRGSTTKFGSKKLWTNLNPLTSSCRQEVRKRSEPLMQAIPSSDFVAPPKDIAFKVGTQMVRRYSLSPLIFSLPLGFRRSCSGEGASSTRGNADNQQRSSLKASIHSKGKAKLCKFSNVVDRVDFEGFGGSAHCGFSVLVFPSSPVTREKGLTSMGTCGLMVVENNELACLNQIYEGINSLKTLLSMPIKAPNLVIDYPVEAEFSSLGGFQIEGLSPNKIARVHVVLSSLDLKVYSRRKNRFSTAQRALRKGELEELLLKEEVHWRQKARVKWVKEGDCNSKFVHKHHRGDLTFYEKLYSSPPGESWRVEGLDWSPISVGSASRLDSPFTEEEISKAIFQLDRNKASGPDGFTIAVFQDC